MLATLPDAGPTARAIRDYAAGAGLAVHTFDCGKRAAPVARADAETLVGGSMTAKRRKKLGRQRRRLADHGAVGFSSAFDAEAVRQALEQFLALEAKGWKGKRGTSAQ